MPASFNFLVLAQCDTTQFYRSDNVYLMRPNFLH